MPTRPAEVGLAAAPRARACNVLARGLSGVALVTSDAHRGLTEAIGATLRGAAGQRCRTQYAANLMPVTPKASWPWVALEEFNLVAFPCVYDLAELPAGPRVRSREARQPDVQNCVDKLGY
jgi:Transposase, Mutator family